MGVQADSPRSAAPAAHHDLLLLLVLRTATDDDSYVPWIVAGVAGLYILWWLVIPAALRVRMADRAAGSRDEDSGGAD